MSDSELYRFGGFELDAELLVLYRNGEIVQLKPKALETLRVLVKSGGAGVSKEDLIEEIWPETFVEENSLSRNIHELRKALSELEEGEYIETIPRRGYRFIPEVSQPVDHELVDMPADDVGRTVPASETRKEPGRVRWHFVAIVLLGVFLLSSFTLWWEFSGYNNSSDVARNKRSIKSVAILPLATLQKSPEDEALSMGLSDALIGKIADFRLFAVRPLSAVRKYGLSHMSAIKIGQELRVDAILVGTIQRSGNKLRVNLHLWDVRDGAQLWTRSFEEVESDLFRLQEAMALQVAEDLVVDLTDSETKGLKKRPTENQNAYKLYLRARYEWDKRTKEGLRESESYHRQAIELDPSFALAYAGLADSYVIFNDYGLAPPEESYSKARAAAGKALEIDPDLAGPRTTLAYVLATYDWEYERAEAEYKKAIEKQPNYATAHQWYGEMLLMTGRFPEALSAFAKARDLDPLVPIIRSEIAVTKFYAGRYDESIADFKKLSAEHPGFPTTYLFLARNYEQKGEFGAALEAEMKYWELREVPAERLRLLREANEKGGHDAYLKVLAEGFEEDARKQYVYEYLLAHVYARMKDREKTLEWLKKGVENRSANIYKSFIDPNFNFLTEDPEFVSLMRKMNLPVQ